jgi:UDP-sugar pyrophosphorylase
MAKTRQHSRWMMDMGVRWTFFFQDTNAVSFRSFIAALGVSKKHNFAMNSITIPRLPGQAVGGMDFFFYKVTFIFFCPK